MTWKRLRHTLTFFHHRYGFVGCPCGWERQKWKGILDEPRSES